MQKHCNTTALTPSGMGRILLPDGGEQNLAHIITAGLIEHKAVLIRNLEYDHGQFTSVALAIGKPMPIDDIEDTEDNTVMILDGKDDAVIKGTGMLPLHRDGILRDRAVDLIMIYCPFDTDGEGSGRTLICDQAHALATMPPSLRTELQTRGLAYKTSEPGFFRNGFYEKWKVIPAIRSTPEREYLNVALAFDNDSNKAWDVCFPDTPKENSDKLLRNLADHLNDPTYTYQHRWKKGDLLVFDNMRTLHGRTAILPGHKRVVWRIQLQGPFTSGSGEC